jgi:ATP-dependent protease HslVU (ClpYQ) peptidase subunit
MTTIIGVQHDDKSEIFVDSRVTDDNGRIYSHPDMKKYAVKGDFIIAGSGETLPCDIAQKVWTPPKPTAKERKDVYSFMITKAMPSLRECLSSNGYNFDEEHDKKKDGERFHLIISCCGELFDIDQELSVCRDENGFYVAGSGGDYAMGALVVGATPLEALEAVTKISAYTAPPFYSIEQYKD